MPLTLGNVYVDILPNMAKFAAQTTASVNAAVSKVEQNVGKSSRRIGREMTTKVSLPVVAVGALAVKAFGDFDQTLRQVGAVTGETGAKMDELRRLAIKMGADTTFSAGEAGQAMLELAKGGLSAAQIQAGALQQTLTLAAAGGIGLEQSATAIANSLNMFGLKAKDAVTVAAALAGGANASTASVDSLTQALSQVGAGAVNAGLDINDTVAALALLDQQGIKGSDAGTSLKTMLAALIPKTKKAKEEMDKFGLSFVNTDGSMMDIADVATQLQEKLGGLTEAERNKALATIFGSDATRAASAMMRGGGKTIEKYRKATLDLGAAERLAKTNTEGQKGAIEQMKGSLETAAIAIGESLSPHVIKLSDQIAKLANKFSAMDKDGQTVIVTILAIAAVAGPATWLIGGMIAAMNGITAAAGLTVAAGKKIVFWYRAIKWNAAAAGKSVLGYAASTVVASARAAAATVASATKSVAALILVGLRWTFVAAMATAAAARIVIAALGRAAVATVLFAAISAASLLLVGLKWTWAGIMATAAALRMAAAWIIAGGPISVLVALIILAVVVIVKNWDKIKAKTLELVDYLKGKFNDFIAYFRALPGRIRAAASGIWDFLKTGFRAAINSIISMWNNLAIPSFSTDPLGKLGPAIKTPRIDFPNIPMLATGGTLAPGQLGIVGERGPEWAIGGMRGTTIAPMTGPRAASRMQLTITNWDEGTGYMEMIADGAVSMTAADAQRSRRMRR